MDCDADAEINSAANDVEWYGICGIASAVDNSSCAEAADVSASVSAIIEGEVSVNPSEVFSDVSVETICEHGGSGVGATDESIWSGVDADDGVASDDDYVSVTSYGDD